MPKKNSLQHVLILGCCFLSSFGVAVGGYSGSVSAASTSGTVSSSQQSYSQKAAQGVQTLQGWYSQGTGLYASPTGWWNAANAITVLVNYESATGDHSYDKVLSNTFTAAQKAHPNFINKYFDDQGWWALAWIDAYDLTRNASYLSMAETIFTNIATNGWDNTVCGGGVWWSTAKTYKNAIPNELFLSIAAKLANRTTGSASATYLTWAEKEWEWFRASGMINAQNLINDGLNSANPDACVNNGRTTWTYNQGVILGGLVELSRADQDATLLPQAEAIAGAAMTNLSTNGILTEPRPVSGGDVPQFKGIFMRNLMALYDALPNTSPLRAQYQAFADANASSIWTYDQGPNHEFGGKWQGPFDSADATRQGSALDAIVAAAAMR